MARLLHVTDLHNRHAWYRWLVERGDQFDLICLTGDLLDECSAVPLSEQIASVTEWLGAVPTSVAVCRGNHDVGPDTRENGDWMQALRGPQRWVDEPEFHAFGLVFGSCGWGIPLPDEINCHVMLAHVAPFSTAPARVSDTHLDMGNLDWDGRILKPRPIILCGHIHRPESWWEATPFGWVCNPGVGSGQVPNHAILDTSRRRAQWACDGIVEQHVNW